MKFLAGDTVMGNPMEKEGIVMDMTPEEAKQIMDTRKDVIVLDVREQEEYDGGHIEGARLLPVGIITADTAAEVIPSKEAEVLVYCRSGIRAGKAAEALKKLGYEKVHHFGGILDWPYETVQ